MRYERYIGPKRLPNSESIRDNLKREAMCMF